MQGENNNSITVSYLKTIFWVFLSAQIIFFLIASIIVKSNEIHISDFARKLISYLVPLIAFFSLAAGILLNFLSARKLRSLEDKEEKIKRFTSANIIGWACVEGAVFISILAYLITGIIDFQIVAIVLILFFIFTIPTAKRIAFALGLDK